MSLRSIQARLTAWYLLILAVGLAALGMGSWLAMHQIMLHTVDEELLDRVSRIRFFLETQSAALSAEEIRAALRERSALGPSQDLFQIQSETGEWLHRSTVLEKNDVPILSPKQVGRERSVEDREVRGVRLRLLSERVYHRGTAYTVQVSEPVNEFDTALSRFRTALLFSIPLLLAVAALGGYWMSRRALLPVDQVIAAVDSIGIQNLSARLDVPRSGDQIQRLSETFNRMLARLDESVQRISQFTADASHELRAPLSLIRTTAELAVQEGRSNPEYRQDMEQILTESERTTRLIESLLLLARADAGSHDLAAELTALGHAVQSAVAQARGLAADKGVRLEIELPARETVICGDDDALRRLFFTLIDNGIKYTPEGGSVTVSLLSHGTEAWVQVADTGAGIAPDDLAHVFDRFWRADKVRSRGAGGTGLGLSIARWIAERHHGTIEVESGVGAGSTFTVRLPLAANVLSMAAPSIDVSAGNVPSGEAAMTGGAPADGPSTQNRPAPAAQDKGKRRAV